MATLISTCECGAATVEHEGQTYSMKLDTLGKHFPDLMDAAPDCEVGSCDYCVNHWGIDLCGCGSGQAPSECDEGYPECGMPMQIIEEGIASPSGGWF